MADQYVGSWMRELMKLLLISSAFVCVLAFHNSATRYFFAMGRADLIPRAFGPVNAGGVPATASFRQTTISGTAGTSMEAWEMSATGRLLALAPFVVFVLARGYAVATGKNSNANDALREFVG